MEPST